MDKEKQLDQLFASAKKAPAQVSFEETKTRFMKSSSLANKSSFSTKLKAFIHLKNIIIMGSIVSIISISIILFWNNSNITNQDKDPVKKEIKTTIEFSNNSYNENIRNKDSIKIEAVKINDDKIQLLKVQSLDQLEMGEIPISSRLPKSLKSFNHQKSSSSPKDEFRFPVLTEDEIKDNHKQKKKMIKALTKLDSKHYTFKPLENYSVGGKNIVVKAFFMQQTEVSNLEYRTFLFDLLIQGRKDEFKAAIPDQTKWVEVLGDGLKAMQDTYFSNDAFDDYPVVNISRKGAEMYCKWLTEETNAELEESDKIESIRIPNRTEWMRAASNSGKNLPYPWGIVIVRNEKNCYLANFDVSTYPDQYNLLNGEYGDGATFTAKTRTYNPNDLGLYNMSGNVAEMVYNVKHGELFDTELIGIGTAGGSWMNTVEEIKINGPDPYDEVSQPHPAIGFRVVFNYTNKR